MTRRPRPSSERIRLRMKRTLRRDTGPELALRSLLHRQGFRFLVDTRPLAGLRTRADLVFRRAKVAVFIDGCFWHGCPAHGSWPKHNARWWRVKILANKQRDDRATALLRQAGWKVVRIWEHEPVTRAATRVGAAVHSRAGLPSPTRTYLPRIRARHG
jgi:DNA mismatch endonuclease (patch repair protein)